MNKIQYELMKVKGYTDRYEGKYVQKIDGYLLNGEIKNISVSYDKENELIDVIATMVHNNYEEKARLGRYCLRYNEGTLYGKKDKEYKRLAYFQKAIIKLWEEKMIDDFCTSAGLYEMNELPKWLKTIEKEQQKEEETLVEKEVARDKDVPVAIEKIMLHNEDLFLEEEKEVMQVVNGDFGTYEEPTRTTTSVADDLLNEFKSIHIKYGREKAFEHLEKLLGDMPEKPKKEIDAVEGQLVKVVENQVVNIKKEKVVEEMERQQFKKAEVVKTMKKIGDFLKVQDRTQDEIIDMILDILPNACEIDYREEDKSISFIAGVDYVGAKPSKATMLEIDENFARVEGMEGLMMCIYQEKNKIKMSADVMVTYADKWGMHYEENMVIKEFEVAKPQLPENIEDATIEEVLEIADELGMPSLDEEVSPEPTAEDVAEWQGLENKKEDNVDDYIKEYNELSYKLNEIEINKTAGIETEDKLAEKINRKMFKLQCKISELAQVYVVKYSIRMFDIPNGVIIFKNLKDAEEFADRNEDTLEVKGIYTNEYGKLIEIDETYEKELAENIELELFRKYKLSEYYVQETKSLCIDTGSMMYKKINGEPTSDLVDRFLKENKDYEMKLFNEQYVAIPHYLIFKKRKR